MEQALQPCPVCTLYLREGMTMQGHLSTHPKDQVIEALVRIYTSNRQFTTGYSPPAIVNPFQVVSEEHIFLGRQQVITNTIHSPPFMSYPLYPNQQILGSSSEFSQSEIQLNVSAQDNGSGIVTTVVNYSNDELYNRIAGVGGGGGGGDGDQGGGEEILGTSGLEVELQQVTSARDYEQMKPLGAVSEEEEQKTNEEGENNIIQGALSQGVPSPFSHHSEASHLSHHHDDDMCHSGDLINMDDQGPGYLEEGPTEDEAKTPNTHLIEDELNDAESSGLNVQAHEKMPARGELSSQGSLGNTMNTVWLAETPTVSQRVWTESPPPPPERKYPCQYCPEDFSCQKKRRLHVAAAHSEPENKKPFTRDAMCLKCGLQLSSDKELRAHINSEHKKVNRQCAVCGLEFKTQEDFSEHLQKVHPLECRTCGKTFHNKPSLYIHTKIHMTTKPYACAICPKTFITNQKLKEHMNGHTGNTPYQCSMCDRKFKRYSNLKQHKDFAHLNVKKKSKEFFCDCGETFHSKKKLEWHRETHSSKPKQCMYCSERYIHAVSLTRHIRRAHDCHFLPKEDLDKKKNVVCPVCNMVFMEGSLRVHMKQHSSSKQYGCIVCGKRFLTKWNLQIHRWTHASRMSKPYKCTSCKAAFIRHSDLIVHSRTHAGNKPFTCNHCGRQFNRKDNWQRHEKEHTQEKNFTCGICDKTFHRSYYLAEHMRIHTGAKPFTCHICNKTSATKSNHNKHIKTHHAREAVNSES